MILFDLITYTLVVGCISVRMGILLALAAAPKLRINALAAP